jgi:hypothetical protein
MHEVCEVLVLGHFHFVVCFVCVYVVEIASS